VPPIVSHRTHLCSLPTVSPCDIAQFMGGVQPLPTMNNRFVSSQLGKWYLPGADGSVGLKSNSITAPFSHVLNRLVSAVTDTITARPGYSTVLHGPPTSSSQATIANAPAIEQRNRIIFFMSPSMPNASVSSGLPPFHGPKYSSKLERRPPAARRVSCLDRHRASGRLLPQQLSAYHL